MLVDHRKYTAKAKAFIKKVVYAVVPPPFVPASYSQAGEDGVLRFLFGDKGITRISYLDIGSSYPDVSNNTYLFYRGGSRGVCVDADKNIAEQIARVRPEDKVLNVGVSTDGSAEADFYLFDCQGISTFDKDEAERRLASGKQRLVEKTRVKLVNVNDLIRDHFQTMPDLISLDIEGLDLSVLRSLDFERYPVPVICVETCSYSENHVRPKVGGIVPFMLSKGYEIYADTYINTIFVNKSWFYRK